MTKQIESKLEKFGPGPWADEPDHVDFEAHGLPCIIHRGPLGAWCGYVGVPPGHPWHGKSYNDRVSCANRNELVVRSPIAAFLEAMQDDDGKVSLACRVDVHGGLTYSEACQGDICHKPKEGEPENVWWLGFDCAHSGDLSPSMQKLNEKYGWVADGGDVYRDQAYVTHETSKLAEQVKAAAT